MPNRVQQKRFKKLYGVPTVVDIKEKIEPAIEPTVVETAVVEPAVSQNSVDELKSLNKAELIALAEQLGLDTTGTKAELIERIANN